jgi:hypothetical protein
MAKHKKQQQRLKPYKTMKLAEKNSWNAPDGYKVLVLDLEGHLVFYGNPIESIVHFKTLDAQINSEVGECSECGNVNPETLFNILETKSC